MYPGWVFTDLGFCAELVDTFEEEFLLTSLQCKRTGLAKRDKNLGRFLHNNDRGKYSTRRSSS